jgi:hypothetical protein
MLRPRAERTDEALHELSGLLVVEWIPSVQRHCIGYAIKNHEIHRLDPGFEAIVSTRWEWLGWRHVAKTLEDQLIRNSENLEPAYYRFGRILEIEIQNVEACRKDLSREHLNQPALSTAGSPRERMKFPWIDEVLAIRAAEKGRLRP